MLHPIVRLAPPFFCISPILSRWQWLSCSRVSISFLFQRYRTFSNPGKGTLKSQRQPLTIAGGSYDEHAQ